MLLVEYSQTLREGIPKAHTKLHGAFATLKLPPPLVIKKPVEPMNQAGANTSDPLFTKNDP